MSAAAWRTSTDRVTGGIRHRLLHDGDPVTFRELLERFEGDDAFCGWYARLLADSEAAAFFWEHPALDLDGLGDPAEWVLIDAPALAAERPDPASFARHFSAAGDAEIAVFENLGGDALLLAPCPRAPAPAYTHLAAFVRQAPAGQVRALWRAAARALRQRVGQQPVWLSTSGLGVPWLHLRLDRRPKYYQHIPYRSPRPAGPGGTLRAWSRGES